MYEPAALTYAKMRQEEVRGAARWCARRGYEGKVGDPLPNLMSSRACTWINGNLRAFREMVREEKTKGWW